MQKIIAFIGAGNMTRSLVDGLVSGGYDPKKIWVTNPSQEKLDHLQARLDIQVTQNNCQAARAADIVIFSVKPQKLHAVACELAPALGSKFIMTVAAGITTTLLQTWLNNSLPIVRCMPNTPASIGAGITGLYASQWVTQTQKEQAEAIMRAVGSVLWVEKEEQIDVVAALSGSGPAYFFKIMESMETAAIKLGLSLEQAHMLTLHTALGATQMAIKQIKSLNILREEVTSKGGMTEKAINVLEKGGIDQLLYDALNAGKQRAQELGKELTANNKI